MDANYPTADCENTPAPQAQRIGNNTNGNNALTGVKQIHRVIRFKAVDEGVAQHCEGYGC